MKNLGCNLKQLGESWEGFWPPRVMYYCPSTASLTYTAKLHCRDKIQQIQNTQHMQIQIHTVHSEKVYLENWAQIHSTDDAWGVPVGCKTPLTRRNCCGPSNQHPHPHIHSQKYNKYRKYKAHTRQKQDATIAVPLITITIAPSQKQSSASQSLPSLVTNVLKLATACPSHFTKWHFWIFFHNEHHPHPPSFRIIIVDHFSEDLLDACVLLGPQLIVGQFLPETTFALLAGQWLYLHGLSLSAPRLSIYQTLVKFRGLLGPNFLGALRALTENLWSCWGRTRLFW